MTTAISAEAMRVKGAMHDAQIALDKLAKIGLEFDTPALAEAIGATARLRDRFRRQYRELKEMGG